MKIKGTTLQCSQRAFLFVQTMHLYLGQAESAYCQCELIASNLLRARSKTILSSLFIVANLLALNSI